ncbi:MAG TPA: glycosyltransferase family 4 protein [Microlunatus sp.]
MRESPGCPTDPRHWIVQVAASYPPRVGGLENVAQMISERLARRHRVEVATTTVGSADAPRDEQIDGVRVRRSRGCAVAHTPVAPGLLLRLLRLPREVIVHAHIAHAFVPEVVWLTSRLRRRDYVAHFHLDADPSGLLGFLLPAYKRLVLGPVLRGAHTVIVLSTEQASVMTDRYGVAPDRVRVVHNGVPDAFYSIDRTDRTDRTDRDDATSSLKLLFVGRLDAQKNPVRLVEAMIGLGELVELVVVGDGELRSALDQLLLDRVLTNVRLVGTQRGRQLRDWYGWADAFVMSSDREGMSISALEALGAGLPVVATDVPGNTELLSGVGLLVPPSVAGLREGIRAVALDAALRADLAARSRAAGRAASWDRQIEVLEEIYNSVQEGC